MGRLGDGGKALFLRGEIYRECLLDTLRYGDIEFAASRGRGDSGGEPAWIENRKFYEHELIARVLKAYLSVKLHYILLYFGYKNLIVELDEITTFFAKFEIGTSTS